MLKDLLARQSSLLDCILEKQSVLHDAVMKKNWTLAQSALLSLEKFQERFVVLDTCREEMSKKSPKANTREARSLMGQVKAKLIKSKIQNEALSAYLSTVTDFMKGMLDKVVPQRANKIYGYNGQFVEAKPSSFVLNALC